MKQSILIFIFSILFITIQAQTPKIAHKSHSGTLATFTTDRLNNFGIPPDYYKKYTKKQKVKKEEATKPKESEYLKIKEIQPLTIEGKIKPIQVEKKKVKDENGKSLKSNSSPKKAKTEKAQKVKNRFSVKKAAVNTNHNSTNHLNWLWVALFGVIIIVGILPIKQ